MAWIAVNEYGEEFIFDYEPHRASVYTSDDEKIEYWEGYREGSFTDKSIGLPEGSIKKLIGKDLTWNDEPVELLKMLKLLNQHKVTVNGKSWMERPLYNIFSLNNNWYIVLPKIDINKKCRGCYFCHSFCERDSGYGRCGETTRSDGIGVIFKQIKMKNNQITIDIPKGMSIDVENSDLSKGIIKFKNNTITLQDVYELSATLPYLHSYYDAVSKHTIHYDYMVALAQLLDIAQFYNGPWKPNWNNSDELKYFILYDNKKQQYSVGRVWECNHFDAYFSDEDKARAVINNPNFREILDVLYRRKE